MQKMYTIIAKKDGFIEWEIERQPKNSAVAQAKEEAKNNPELQIFVVIGDIWLNSDGNHDVVGKAW